MKNSINKHILEAVMISKLESQITEDIDFKLLKKLIRDVIKTTNNFDQAVREVEKQYIGYEVVNQDIPVRSMIVDWSRVW